MVQTEIYPAGKQTTKRKRERERAGDINFLYSRVKESSFIGPWPEEAIVERG